MSLSADATAGPRVSPAGRRLRAFLAGLALLLGVLQVWAHRYAVWGDLVSYIEVGEAYLQGRWSDALSAHWSPLYSWVLGSVLAVVRPSPGHEILAVKATGLLIYAFNVVAFDRLLRGLLARLPEDRAARGVEPLPAWVLVLSGYAVFTWASLKWMVLFRDTPDLLVAGLAYVAAALALRAGRSGTRRDAVTLGLVLGLAYLAKTVMFPLAFLFLGVFALGTRRDQRARLTGAALLAFLAVSAPYAAVLSAKQGRLTIGESGRLNYAWVVSPEARDVHWQGDPPGSGRPLHPTRQVFSAPDVYEFATPIAGTYPVWYDPAYWNEGLTPRVDLGRELHMIWRNARACFDLFGLALLGGFLLVAAVGGSFRASLASLATQGRLLIPGLGGLALFAVATQLKAEQPPWGYLQTRYIAPFVVLLFLAALATVRVEESRRRATWSVVVTAALAALLVLTSGVSRDVATAWALPPEHTHWQVAQGLRDLGLPPESRLAIVGTDAFGCYWARLARMRVVVEVEARGFWTADEATRAAAVKPVREVGVRALVAMPPARGSKRPKDLTEHGWRRLGPTDYFTLGI